MTKTAILLPYPALQALASKDGSGNLRPSTLYQAAERAGISRCRILLAFRNKILYNIIWIDMSTEWRAL